jgi:hypothetical protein
LLAARLRLFEKAAACAEFRNKTAEDLTYDDEACQREMNDLLATCRKQVQTERERFFELAKSRVAEIAPVLKTIDKQKEREKYNLLDNEKTYYRTRLESMQKELRELIKAAGEEVKKLKKTEPADSPKLKRLADEIAAREARLAELSDRSKAILNP